MTTYKETKHEIEKILGVKAKNIYDVAQHMAEKPSAACCIANEKYSIYLFKTSEIEYDSVTVYDTVLYYAIETSSKLPVSWHYNKIGLNEKYTGYNYAIKTVEIENTIDEKLMFALCNCSHMGHFEETSLFD